MPRRQRLAARAGVLLAGAAVLGAAALGGLDLWSGVVAATGMSMLGVSTVLLRRWPDGPTVFLAFPVIQAAIAPAPSPAATVVLVGTVAGYLLVVELVQSSDLQGSNDAPDRGWLTAQFPALLSGALLGTGLVCCTDLGGFDSGWGRAAAVLIAASSATAVIMFASRRQFPTGPLPLR